MVAFTKVREARLASKEPMVAVAQAAGHSIGWVYALERGTVVPSRSDAEAIAELLEVPVAELFERVRDDG